MIPKALRGHGISTGIPRDELLFENLFID